MAGASSLESAQGIAVVVGRGLGVTAIRGYQKVQPASVNANAGGPIRVAVRGGLSGAHCGGGAWGWSCTKTAGVWVGAMQGRAPRPPCSLRELTPDGSLSGRMVAACLGVPIPLFLPGRGRWISQIARLAYDRLSWRFLCLF